MKDIEKSLAGAHTEGSPSSRVVSFLDEISKGNLSEDARQVIERLKSLEVDLESLETEELSSLLVEALE